MQLNISNKLTIDDVVIFFNERIESALKRGVAEKNIIIDPGIGFGKTISDNYMILNNIDKLLEFNLPILLGISRKSFLQYENDTPNERLSATIGISSLVVKKGVSILRVHDVLDTRKMINAISNIV